MKYYFNYDAGEQSKVLEIEAREVDFTIERSELAMWGAVGSRTFNDFGVIPSATSTEKYYYQYKQGGGTPYTQWVFLPPRINAGLGAYVDWQDTKYQLVMSAQMKFFDGTTFSQSSYKKLHCGQGHCFLNFAMQTDIEQGQPVTRFTNNGFCLFDPYDYDRDSGLVAPNSTTAQPLTYDTRWRAPNLYFMRCKLHDDDSTSTTYNKTFNIIAILKSTDDRYTPGLSYSEVIFIDERLFGDGKVNPDPTPSKPGQNSTPGGWHGTRSTFSHEDTPTVAPNALKNSVNFGEHGIFLYALTNQQLVNVSACLWSKSILDALQDSKYSPNSGVLSLHKLPYAPEVTSQNAMIKSCGTYLDKYELNIKAVTVLGKDIPIPEVNLVTCYGDEISGGQEHMSEPISVNEIYNSFLDFEPYTTISIRIPFIGSVPIPTSTCMGGQIKLNYIFDNRNGNLCAQVLCKSKRNLETDDGDGWVIINQYSGNCALPAAITGNTNGGEQKIGAITGLASSIASSNYAVSASEIVKLATAKHETQIMGSVHGVSAILQDLTARVIIKRPVDITPGNFYGDDFVADALLIQKGIASFGGGQVKDYSGMTVGYVLGDVPNATDAEKVEIKNLFLGGVIV